MTFGVSEKDFEKILFEIKKKIGTTVNPKLYIYGSRVKGNFRKYSDIDLLLIADLYDDNKLATIELDELDIPYKVDLVLGKNLYEKYRSEIYKHMIEIPF